MIWQSLLGLLGFVLFLAVITSIYLVRISLKPKVKDYEKTMEMEVERGWFTKDYWEGLPKIEEYLDSPMGYRIHGFWIPNKGAKKSVILAHGFSFSLFGSVKYIDTFRRLGYNIFLYDQRFHGLSGGKTSTFGWKEKKDLKVVVDYVKKMAGQDSLVGTHGESLGGATVLQHAVMDDRVAFVISDCSFSGVGKEFAHRLKEEYKLPAFPIIPIASFITWLRTGAFYGQISPARAAKKIKVPTMVIHGTGDTYTPFEQGQKIYDALEVDKRFYKVEGAEHAGCLKADPKAYYLEVKKFLNDFVD